MPLQTMIHALPYPEPTDIPDVPEDMRRLAEALDIALSKSVPIGVVLAWSGLPAAVPAGWHLCDGTPHNSQELLAVLGSPNTPNLMSRFIYGGTNRGTTGGAATVKLTGAQSGTGPHQHDVSTTASVPAHTHTVPAISGTTGHVNSDHTHSGVTGHMNQNNVHGHGIDAVNLHHGHGAWTDGGTGHNHGSAYANNWQGSDMAQNPSGTDYMPIGQSAPGHRTTDLGHHTHGVGISGSLDWHSHGIHGVDINHTHSFTTGGISANHGHPFTVPANTTGSAAAPPGTSTITLPPQPSTPVDASQAHENMPPYYVMAYIIKKS